jgi:hypothetical protein
MGGALPRPPAGAAPRLLVAAERDPGTAELPGTPLQKIQVIKGWLDPAGDGHIAVFDLVAADTLATLDEATCTADGAGADALCGVWTDDDYDPALPTFYYARVLEDPTCRWSARDCLALPAADRPPVCDDLPRAIQERAWTSPVWAPPGA